MLSVVEHSENDCRSWDEYVHTSSNASAFHLWGWKRIFEKTYGLKASYLSVQNDGQIVGVLPLIFVKGPVLGNYLTSMTGGIAAESDEAALLLYQHAVELVKKNNFNYLALRDCSKKLDHPELVTDDGHVSMVLEMIPDFEELQSNVDRKTKQRINKAKKQSLVSVLGNQAELIEKYYPIYLQAMKERGTPTQGMKFFKNSIKEYPERLMLLAIQKDGDMLGGGYSFTYRDTLVCLWSGMARQYLSLNTSYLLIWDTIELAKTLGVRWVDLGRSQIDSGTYKHKKQWGAKPVKLYQQYYLHKAKQAPSSGNNRNEELMYQTFVKTWRKMPTWMTEIFGPVLRKQVPFG